MNQQIALGYGFGATTTGGVDPRLKTLIQKNAELQVLLELSHFLTSTLDMDAILNVIIKVATEVTDTEAASILLLDEKTGELRFEAAMGVNAAEIISTAVPLEQSIAGWIVRHNQPQIVKNVYGDPRHYSKIDRQTKFITRSLMGVPLKVKHKTIGVLEVLNKRKNNSFTKHDLNILEVIAAQVAVTIDNARLCNDLRTQVQNLKDTQARLVQSEKLAAVGELVAGVAHELNNPLTAIIGFAEILQLQELNDKSQQDLNRIIKQAERAANIVRSLLNFARPHPAEQRPVQINDVIKNTIDLFGYELRTHSITVQTDLSADLPVILADPHQLQQVFVNLIQNARHALAAGNYNKQITITTGVKAASIPNHPEEKSFGRARQKDLIGITFQDNGPGIPPDQLTRIFDPFFTTKEPGEGTGLGLSVCHGIITEHNGHIWADSNRGEGATFYIELPINGPNRPTQVVPPRIIDLLHPKPVALKTNITARLLIVEDESDILTVMLQTLQEQEYQVDALSDGYAALACLTQIPYDLILCDIRMAGLNGLDLHRQIREVQPDMAQRFMFITGDVVSPTTRRFLNDAGTPYLDKPFKPEDLIQKVQRALSRG